MYCKFCEKDAQKEPSCATCGKTTVDRLGWWSRYSPALVWPFATWLIGFGVYRLIIAFQPLMVPSSLSDLGNENAIAGLKRKNMDFGHHPRHLNAEI